MINQDIANNINATKLFFVFLNSKIYFFLKYKNLEIYKNTKYSKIQSKIININVEILSNINYFLKINDLNQIYKTNKNTSIYINTS